MGVVARRGTGRRDSASSGRPGRPRPDPGMCGVGHWPGSSGRAWAYFEDVGRPLDRSRYGRRLPSAAFSGRTVDTECAVRHFGDQTVELPDRLGEIGNLVSALPGPDGDVVTVEVPADVSYVSTLRLTAAGLAARCELTIDDIEDLRLAVDEACALLLPNTSGDRITARFELVVRTARCARRGDEWAFRGGRPGRIRLDRPRCACLGRRRAVR